VYKRQGGGHAPHIRANVVVDKYVDDNTHRSGDIKVNKKQKFIHADGESLPFSDNEFDYVICKHVIEHVDDPIKFLQEISRVGKKGYLEAPTLMGEILHPKKSHRWVLMEIDDELLVYDKKEINFKVSSDFGQLFLSYLQKNSLGYKLFDRTFPLIRQIQIEWKDDITCIVNSKDPDHRKFFTEEWSNEMVELAVPKSGIKREVLSTFSELINIFRSYVFKVKI